MPALFIGHGSPMNTLEENGFTRGWRALGRALPRPRAILAVSAHWYSGATAITAMPRPRTIHDFYGFPQELFDFQYPATGDPDLAGEIAELVKPDRVGLDRDQWGIDHGTWSVLAHLYPEADIPVLQLSLNALQPLEYHIVLARKLVKLREMGVLVLGSGNVVHNLRMLDRERPDMGYDWAQRFDEAAMRQLADDPAAVLRLAGHPDYARAVPTPDHFIPLLYLAGMGAEEKQAVEPVLQGYSMGGISMTSYGIGVDAGLLARLPDEAEGAARVPTDVPAVETNT